LRRPVIGSPQSHRAVSATGSAKASQKDQIPAPGVGPFKRFYCNAVFYVMIAPATVVKTAGGSSAIVAVRRYGAFFFGSGGKRRIDAI